MDMADEMDVGRKLRQHAFAAVGAVASDEDVALGKPGGGQGNQLDGQLGASAMIGRSFGLLGFLGVLFLAFGESLPIAVKALSDRQGEDFGGRPKRMDDEDG